MYLSKQAAVPLLKTLDPSPELQQAGSLWPHPLPGAGPCSVRKPVPSRARKSGPATPRSLTRVLVQSSITCLWAFGHADPAVEAAVPHQFPASFRPPLWEAFGDVCVPRGPYPRTSRLSSCYISSDSALFTRGRQKRFSIHAEIRGSAGEGRAALKAQVSCAESQVQVQTLQHYLEP